MQGEESLAKKLSKVTKGVLEIIKSKLATLVRCQASGVVWVVETFTVKNRYLEVDESGASQPKQ